MKRTTLALAPGDVASTGDANMPYCIGCKQNVEPVPGRDFHVTRSPIWTGEDVPYTCGPVYLTKDDAVLAQLRDAAAAVDSLMGSDEEWADDALWVALVEPGGLVEAVKQFLENAA